MMYMIVSYDYMFISACVLSKIFMEIFHIFSLNQQIYNLNRNTICFAAYLFVWYAHSNLCGELTFSG